MAGLFSICTERVRFRSRTLPASPDLSQGGPQPNRTLMNRFSGLAEGHLLRGNDEDEGNLRPVGKLVRRLDLFLDFGPQLFYFGLSTMVCD